MSLAVISTGGKQYLVKAGDSVKIEKIEGNEGDTVKFDTLLITDETGENLEVGAPVLKKQVTATIVKTAKDDKILVGKYKSKVRYKKRLGHRQLYTLVKIEAI